MERLSDYAGIKVSYEPSGSSSRLMVTLDEDIQVMHYQILMLDNNVIENLLPLKMLQKNNQPQLYYNITSKTSLGQAKVRRKMSRNNFINFVLGTIKALKEAEEYQLTNTGIVFDPEYIYIDPSTYSPMFMYLPIFKEDSDIQRLKNFIGELIMGDSIEDTRDNFVQLVLIAINQEQLTLDSLSESLAKLRDERGSERKAQPSPTQPTVYAPPPDIQRQPMPLPTPQPVTAPPAAPNPPDPPKPVKVKAPIKINKAVVIFSVVQIAVVGVLVALFTAGAMYKPGTKEIDPLNAMILVLAAAGVDIIVYREMFVNKAIKDGKGAAGSEASGEPVKAKKAKKEKPKKSKPARPPVPGAAVPHIQPSQMPAHPQQAPVQMQQPAYPQQATAQMQQPAHPQQAPVQMHHAPAQMPPVPRLAIYKADNEGSFGETELMADSEHPYLECTVNGCVQKITLTKKLFTIGRLAGQVDYVCASTKVGRLHADFILRDGYVYVRDNNTRNGTYINAGPKLVSNTEYQLFPKDKVTLADVDFILHM